MFKTVLARLSEASTYAGIAALATAVASALELDGQARYIALAVAGANAVAAIARAESARSVR